ncbi:MAG TPA: peptidylprolyl isomerase [Kiritimatiellia bacterium]|jgi:peptidyl-prolyl cis-trans isomerase C|nr:MAG: Peptidyl-prolyl cis-trans isomerase C [Verrucomicrobia bacterium ADurb.Bin070]HPB11096.1 peptidylprolyl isomerase [Kiritimatiellia bacterium]HPO37760.1 peptidylprolyl isomerase [Kiritimatiellia bacterium]HQA38743.1 peptidylprolyl isomerase [Kiritimatiellia bacterium]HQL50479.1 peptidylprolyl isomerase [Kiritimatiellia bacterium]
MKCAPLFSLTLASTLVVATGCKKESEVAKAADTPAAPVAVPAEPAADPNEVVASVNDTKYLRKDMAAVVDALIKAQNVPAEQMAEARKYFEQRAAYSFIMKTLLLGEAKKQAITVTDEDRKTQLAKMEEALKPQNKTPDQYFKESPLGEEAARAEFEDGMVIDKLIQKNVLADIKIDEADVKKAIADVEKGNAEIAEKNKGLDTDKAAKKAKIESIKQQIAGGADFAELAKANSDCPSGQKGGDLGEFTRGQMVKPFEDAAFTQEIGKVGDIIETQFGYHLIKVTAKSPATEAKGDTPAKPEAVTASHILVKIDQAQQPQPVPTAEQVTEQLKQGKSREAVQKYIEGLKAAAKIETVFKEMQL